LELKVAVAFVFPFPSKVCLDPSTYALPIRHGSALPDLPATVITGIEDLKKLKSAVVIPHIVHSAFSLSLYSYTTHDLHRNLYRIPLQ